MTGRSQMRKLFALHLPQTSRASRQRRRRQTHVARMLLEQLEGRVMLSATIVTTTNGVTQPTAWMGSLPGSIPLTDISLPGTVNSASGPSLQDALMGSGSENEVNPPSALNDAALAQQLLAATDAEAAIATGGEDPVTNATAIAAAATATADDTAAGITQTSTGAGLAISLASDITGLASAIASATQAALSSKDATADTAANTANTAVATSDPAEGTAATTAGTANGAAGIKDTAAGGADTAAGGADTAAGGADTAAGGADTAAAVADGAAVTADVVAGGEGGIDPVADGVAAGLDATGAGLDATAGTLNTAADVANVAADAANGTADTANTAEAAAVTEAVGANTAVSGAQGAATTADTAANTEDGAAFTAHTAAAVADGNSAASNVAGAASDLLTAQQYGSFAAGMLVPGSTTAFATAGNNSNNTSYQQTIYGLAVAGAAAHTASATAETAAAGFDTAATVANTTAAFADQAAANAAKAADAANAAAVAADEKAATDDATATGDDALAATADGLATGDDTAATTADSAAEGFDAAAGTADGVSAGAETAAAAADTTAIALDATALATIEIPFVDIATAVAAGIADGVAAGLDATSVVADTADGIADGLAITADGTAAGLDGTAATEDGTAAGLDETAAAADATAAAADATAAADDATAAADDAAAVTASEAATAANNAADTADTNADNANKAATQASAAALTADIAFFAETTTVQGIQTSLQTQTLGIADQLNAGIRSLDLRGALVNDTINLNTDPNLNTDQYFTGVTLQDGLNDMTSFLQANPSETIVVKLSDNEAASSGNSNDFNTDLNTLLNSSDTGVPNTTYKDFIYSSSNPTTTPDLDQVRGKIVIIPDQSWTPTADSNGQTIGWQPTEVVQDSHTVADPNARWNYAENDNGANDNGLIPTDLGNPDTLYRNNLTQDGTSTASPVALGDSVNAIAEQYFASGSGTVTRTTGIVGMDDPDQNLINEIINENNLPIIVTSDSDATGDTGTLRDAITQANSQPGVNTIEFADDLTGSTGNTIVLQSDLPQITNDLVIAGTVLINTNGFQGLQAASTHNVTETDYFASASGVTQTPSTDTTAVYLDTSGLTEVGPGTVAVDPVNITYGTALDNSQLNGIVTDTSGASIPGTFSYTSTEAGTVLMAGNGQSEAVTFTPTDTSLAQEFGTVMVNVAKATPKITNVSSPVNITYGTALDNTQLSGTATVPGTFIYTSAAGHVLHFGNGQSESITFIPTDTTDYTSVSSTVTVNVAQATPTVTVDPVNISYGTPLDNTQLSGTATFTVGGNSVTVPGTFTYTSADGTVLNGGNNQSEAVTFTPQDSTDYTTVSSGLNVIVNVSSQAAPTVAINEVNITYGTALANSQLSGTAIFILPGKIVVVPGTFTYTTDASKVLSAGNDQSEAVTFTPNDTTTYTEVSSNVIVNVTQATPTISKVSTVNITYGTALANGQLSGTATYTVGGNSVPVPGTFTYTSATGVLNAGNGQTQAFGTVLSAGNDQSEAVTFTPTDATDYTPASGTVTVNVGQATPTVTINPVNIIYGTALANSQLSGTVTFTVDGNTVPVVGTFTYTSAAGSQLNIGNGQTEAVTFTPNDTTDYTTVSSSVTVNVLPITPTVTVTDAGGIYKGSPFAATGTVTGVGGVSLVTPTNPTFLYYLATDTTFAHPLAGAPSDAGNYVAVALFAATGNYGVGAAETSFSITPAATATTITSSANPAVYGQPITYTATVTNTSGTTPAPVPVGSVQFVVDGGGSTGQTVTVPLNASGQAVLPDTFLSGASHTVQAYYLPSTNSIGNTNFVQSNSNSLTQVVQSIAVEGTALFIGSNGATSNDQIQISPIGSSNTGSTGVQVQTSLNGVKTQTTYSQSFTAISAFLQNGNDNVQLANTLTISAVVTAGNGNDIVQLGGGNNIVTLGTGNDNVQLGNGNNVVLAGTGNDNIQAGNGTNTVTAGAAGFKGNDQITVGNGANNVVTLLGNGNDQVMAGNGNNDSVSITGNGNDTVTVGNGTGDSLSITGAGNDMVTAGNGNNDSVSITGNGNDTVTVGNGTGDSVTIVGNGNNTVKTGTGSGTVQITGTGHNTVRLGSSGWKIII
jgi:hypothetical protein